MNFKFAKFGVHIPAPFSLTNPKKTDHKNFRKKLSMVGYGKFKAIVPNIYFKYYVVLKSYKYLQKKSLGASEMSIYDYFR
jgi:hypothetical protein